MRLLTLDVRVDVPGFGVDAAFSVGTGITVLAGPSGSGKSLTLAAVAGTVRPTRGSIRFGDAVFVDVDHAIHRRSQDRELGVVYQHAALLDHRSPLDNVMLAVREGNVSARRLLARELLQRVGAGELADAKTRSLSGGERQRIALARAVAGNPRLLLLDEPFSSLDSASRAHLRELLKSFVAERHLTALVVTHDQADVDALADRVVVYEPGRTVSASE
ncbi:MAG: ATP-binding cassette domain-containing protein [Ilumatobacteraceae bacterium]